VSKIRTDILKGKAEFGIVFTGGSSGNALLVK
jgi:hypothetical protein